VRDEEALRAGTVKVEHDRWQLGEIPPRERVDQLLQGLGPDTTYNTSPRKA